MSKQEAKIAVRGETALAEPVKFGLANEERVGGTDALGGEDLRIPRLVLVQAQSQNVPDHLKHVGEWYNNLTGEYAGAVDAVLMSVVKGRTAFPREYRSDSDPLCRSDDAIYPVSDYIGKAVTDTLTGTEWEIEGSPCAQCPFSQFVNDKPPLCAKSYSYAMLDVTSGLPFVVRAQRTGTGAAKQLNTIAKMMGRRRVIHISSREVKSETGNYFEPLFSVAQQTDTPILMFANELSASLGNFVQRSEPTNGPANGHAPDGVESKEEEVPW